MYIDVDLYTSQVNKTLGNFNENLLHLLRGNADSP